MWWLKFVTCFRGCLPSTQGNNWFVIGSAHFYITNNIFQSGSIFYGENSERADFTDSHGIRGDVMMLCACLFHSNILTNQMVIYGAATWQTLWFVGWKGSIWRDNAAIKTFSATCQGNSHWFVPKNHHLVAYSSRHVRRSLLKEIRRKWD